MSLAKKISEDVKSALKGGDKKKLSIARYIYSELKNFLIKENPVSYTHLTLPTNSLV